MSRIVVFGGTFDPVHIGHLIVAEEVLESSGADRILFIPARQPPHKPARPITPGRHRLAMVELAIRNNKRFETSDIELRRRGRSYTIDSLRALRRKFGSETELTLVVGADQILEFETWKDYRRIAAEYPLILTTRAGYARSLKRGRPYLKDARILVVPDIGISATEIRDRVRRGRSIRYLVPAAVERYIRTQRLYR